MFPGLFNGTGKSTRESDVYAFGMSCLELFTERVPFHDMLATALPLEIATKGLEPTWPGTDAEERGLTASIWEFMKNCWKRFRCF